MRQFFVFILVLLLPSLSVQAQDTLRTPSEPPEWGEVSPQTLRVDDYPADSNASAVILSDYGDVWFHMSTGQFEMERHTRIKILNESGFEKHGTVKVPYYVDENLQDVSSVEGRTYTLSKNGTVQVHELEKKDVFREKINDNWERVQFTLPRLEEGAVIEYRYEFTSEDYLRLPDWSFQRSNPTLYSHYDVRVPPHLEYVPIVHGNPQFDSVYVEEKSSSVGVAVEKHWIVKDMPALREESFMTTLDNYRARMDLQVRTVRDPASGEVLERYMEDWSSLAERLMGADYFGDNLGTNADVEKKVEQITSEVGSDSAAARAIYNYVRESITWDGTYSRGKDREFDAILKAKTGTNAEVNLLLVSMLRHAGLTAHPVLISTREHGRPLPKFPLLDQFNAVIAAVSLPNRTDPLLLDGTSSLCPASLLPVRDLNRKGWLVREEEPSWIDLPSEPATRRIYVKGKLKSDGTLAGKLNVMDRGYQALDSRQAVQGKEPAVFVQKHLFGGAPMDSLSNATVKNKTVVDEPLTTTANLSLRSGRSAGSMLYLNPRLLPTFAENPFKSKTRTFPVDFAYPRRIHYILILRLPQGYEVKETPANKQIAMPKDEVTYTRRTQVRGPKIIMRSNLQIRETRILPQHYGALRKMFARIVSAQSEQLVLEKADGSVASGEDE